MEPTLWTAGFLPLIFALNVAWLSWPRECPDCGAEFTLGELAAPGRVRESWDQGA